MMVTISHNPLRRAPVAGDRQAVIGTQLHAGGLSADEGDLIPDFDQILLTQKNKEHHGYESRYRGVQINSIPEYEP